MMPSNAQRCRKSSLAIAIPWTPTANTATNRTACLRVVPSRTNVRVSPTRAPANRAAADQSELA